MTAFWQVDRLAENVTFELSETPCLNGFEGQSCYYPSGVSQLFPNDKDFALLNADGYLGIPLYNATRPVVGHLAVIDDKRSIHTSEAEFAKIRHKILLICSIMSLNFRRGKVMAIRWTHITIGVSDIDRSIAFYKEFCGLSIVRDRRKEGGGTVWLGYKKSDGQNPLYFLVIATEENFSLLDHFGFQCDSREEVDEIAEKARNSDILVLPPKDSGGSVGYWTMIKDPDGHLVEFTFGQPINGIG